MALELRQNLKLSQTLVMTPQLQQAIKLLQLSRMELVDLIRTEMEQNPLLEEPQEGSEVELNEAHPEQIATLNEGIEASELGSAPAEAAQPDLAKTLSGEVKRDDIDWERFADNYQTPNTTGSSGAMNSEDLPSFEATHTRPEGLTEHLIEQLRMAGFNDVERRVGTLIIGNLNRDGYLVIDPDLQPTIPLVFSGPEDASASDQDPGAEAKPVEVPAVAPEALEALRAAQAVRTPVRTCDPIIALALEAGVSAILAEKVMKRIQKFDPVGCACRDLRECLLVQAKQYLTEGEGKDDPDAELLPKIVGRHLKNVETKKYQAIAKDLDVSLEEV
ncbi:MAG TPA: hypothetical protein VH083_02030, partial [Myxococcales bacterium]|nr:hypothetical protein [Myxococcales bacterium]